MLLFLFFMNWFLLTPDIVLRVAPIVSWVEGSVHDKCIACYSKLDPVKTLQILLISETKIIRMIDLDVTFSL